MPGSPWAPIDQSEFHGYILGRHLGAGGMGVVYLASRPELSYPVAVKVMRPELADDPGFRARFAREIAAVRAVQGPHTVRIIDAGTTKGCPYLVTEYIDGPTLSEVITSGPLGSGQVRLLARSLAVALTDIHDAGIVHRDLKPANVLMGRDGIKVIDFGIAQLAEASTMLTGTGAAIGTAGYMAPEQIRGTPGPATDVFAWAVTVAHAASGRPPFGTGPSEAVIYRILHDEPDLGRLPPGLAEPVYAAAAKDPAKRPTAAQLIAMLDGRLPAPSVTPFTAPLPAPQATRPYPTPVTMHTALAPQASKPVPSRRGALAKAARRLATIAVSGALIVGVIAVISSQNTSGDQSQYDGAANDPATASEPPPAQQVHYDPFKGSTDPYGGPGPGYSILRHAYGRCTSPSAAAPTRVDAYSCTGTLEDPADPEMNPQVQLDPCFAPPQQSGLLLCPDTVEAAADGFSFKKLIQFEPSNGLADPSPSSSPKDGGFFPIGIQIGNDGTQCYFSPFADTKDDNPHEETMFCGSGTVTVPLDKPLDAWTVKYRANTTSESQAVTIKVTKVFK